MSVAAHWLALSKKRVSIFYQHALMIPKSQASGILLGILILEARLQKSLEA